MNIKIDLNESKSPTDLIYKKKGEGWKIKESSPLTPEDVKEKQYVLEKQKERERDGFGLASCCVWRALLLAFG